MTIREALKKYHSIDETELFLSHLLKYSKSDLIKNPSQKLTKSQEFSLDKMIGAFKKGAPAAYLLGYKYFYGQKFKVNRSVLIPRPESEWLVDKTLDYINTKNIKSILDIGTGSGCLAISIFQNSPAGTKIKVTATDISPKALKIAQANAKSLKSKVTFKQSDLLSNIRSNPDLIIANLPYVPVSDYRKFISNLKQEPKLALTDGTNDSILYTKLIEQISKRKQKPKVILFELDPSTKPILSSAVRQFLGPKSEQRPYKLTFHKDLNQLIRYAVLEF
ncbi:peptide chain release factor N(5)-glutamine methyltransferase [bacterium]|nr:MAG: peptide chain release factor N(5)-glutamine methyltransferase [bacterium]